MPQDMYEGRARGGPRDGVKISAPLAWNGKVRIPGKDPKERATDPDSNRVNFYSGHYAWREVAHTWVWVPHFVASEKKRDKPHGTRRDKHDW